MDKDNKPKTLIWSIIGASTLFIIDSFVLGAPYFFILVLIGLIFFWIPSILFSLKKPDELKFKIGRALIYTVMVISTKVLFDFNNNLAEERAEIIISALDTYLQKENRYPDELQKLVPEFLDSIPKPKIGPSKYYYSVRSDNTLKNIALDCYEKRYEYTSDVKECDALLINASKPQFFYVRFPPYDRASWDFEKKEWVYISD
jgi:hypothetical protein